MTSAKLDPQSQSLPAPASDFLRLAKNGDPGAFCELVREHEERLFRQALLLCADPAHAEDLAQETLFVAWKRIQTFDGQCRFFTWLCGILLNLGRNAARKKEHQPLPLATLAESSQEDTEEWLHRLPDPSELPDAQLHRRERLAAVRRCLDRLPEIHREVVHLRFFVDDSLDSIAAALGCSVGTVKSRLFNALGKLQQMPDLQHLANQGTNP